jgi:neutral ceramidase
MKRSLLISILSCWFLIFSGCETTTDLSNSIKTISKSISNSLFGDSNSTYLIGSGIYDITGPAAESGMMGYSMLDQKTEGIHMRLRARAFIVGDLNTEKRIVFVSADTGIIPQGVKLKVINILTNRFSTIYSAQNVAISATHTHSAPGAYSHYALYDLSMLGYDSKNFNTVVNGIVEAISRAHDNLTEGTISLITGRLDNCGWNRSPLAYEQNPQSEKSHYGENTDKTMTLLKFTTTSGEDIGILNWFAIHPTNLGNTNKLISGDNKGYASYLFEKMMGTIYTSNKTFVASFAQSNSGDVSPNIIYGYPDGINDFKNMKEIGQKLFQKAKDLYNTEGEKLSGNIDYRHVYTDFSRLELDSQYTSGNGTTCTAAIGISKIAGSTEDGRGLDIIDEGIIYPYEGDLSWINFVFPWGFTIVPEDQDCHGSKPILLPLGKIKVQGIPLTPEVLPVQILRIGNLAIVSIPSELTTMAGRRIQQTALEKLEGIDVDHVVISALSNAYAGYIATKEEYSIQNYEGASTHFGPNTLAAYRQQVDLIASAMAGDYIVDSGPEPRNIENNQILRVPEVVFDDKPLFKSFGSVYSNANSSYNQGQTVSVIFWGAHPRNNFQTQSSFLKVQKKSGSSWITISYDWDPETIYKWKRDSVAFSKITCTWTIPETTTSGTYRIQHSGHWKSGWTGKISSYTGTSQSFTVQ